MNNLKDSSQKQQMIIKIVNQEQTNQTNYPKINHDMINTQTKLQKLSMRQQIKSQNQDLMKQISLRDQELHHLLSTINHIKQVQQKLIILETQSLSHESQLDDLEKLNKKLNRQLKLLSEEQQIMKGKVIIEYNNTLEIRQQQQTQQKNKLFLQKHLQEIKKGSENLYKKIKLVKDQIKKNKNKPKIQIQLLKNQIKDSQSEYQKKQIRYKKVVSIKENNYVHMQIYKNALQEHNKLKKEAAKCQQLQNTNTKLLQQKQHFEQRISFLKNMDNQFLNQKKALLNQLKQQYNLHLQQNKSINSELIQNQEKLKYLSMTNSDQSSNSQLKKAAKKKEVKSKKNTRQMEQQFDSNKKGEDIEVKRGDDRQGYRWRGHKLKKIVIWILVFLLMMGVVFSQMMQFFFITD